VVERWVTDVLVGFVPEGRYEGSDSTELAEVLARSAWGNAKTAPVPWGRYEEVPSASFIGWIMFVAIVCGQMPELNRRISIPKPADARAIRTWRSTPSLQYSITPRGRIRGRERRRVRGRSAPLIILAKADIFQALVKAVGLFELGDGNRVGSVPTALKQFSIHGKNFIEAGC
jgi:hypothetical protein